MRGKIFITLKKDHDLARELLEQLSKTRTSSVRRRAELLRRLAIELKIHKLAEEAVFYPALMEREETRLLVEAALQEHAETDHLLNELRSIRPEDDDWKQRLLQLRDRVEQHIRSEERELLPEAQRVLAPDDADDLDDRFQAEKKVHRRHLQATSP